MKILYLKYYIYGVGYRMLLTLNKYMVILLSGIILIDPANKIFGLKEIIFVISSSILFLLFIKYGVKKKYLYVVLSYFIIPNLYSAIMVTLNNAAYFSIGYYNTYFFGSFFGFFLLNLSFIEKEDLKIIFLKIMKCYSIIYLMVIIFFYLNLFGFNEKIYQFSIEKENMMISFFHFKTYRMYQIFYKTSPVLVLYYSYLLYNKKIIMTIIIAFLLIVSGTAANLLSLFMITVFYLISRILRKKSIKRRIFLFGIIGVISLFILKNRLFYSDDLGNSIKLGHLHSYLNYWKYNFNKFLFGSGIGSGFFSKGRESIVCNTELSYLELIRLYGVFIASYLVMVLIFPLKRLIINKEKEWLFIGYLAYLGIGGTNPFILGSTGAFVLMVVYRLSKEN